MSMLSARLLHTNRVQKASRWGIRETLVGDMPSATGLLSRLGPSQRSTCSHSPPVVHLWDTFRYVLVEEQETSCLRQMLRM